jgi:3-dehydroquinate synthase
LATGLNNDLQKELEALGVQPPFVMVTDSNVRHWHAQGWAKQLDAALISIPAGEKSKTLDSAHELYTAFLEHSLDRAGTVLAVGGGMICDLAGFAAATYLRGVRWVALPTSLLAMVDASVGAKVGVDLPQGKNLVGAFHPPTGVLADLSSLQSLPAVELRSGLAEVIKAALIDDPDLLTLLEEAPFPANRRSIERALAVKIRIVDQDPFERGRRATLNLGHTIGHGLESASGYALRHGEAIAIGLLAEADLAHRLGLAASGLIDRLYKLMEKIGLPTYASGLEPLQVRQAMQQDKKRRTSSLRFTLPTVPGVVRYGVEAPEEVLMEVIHTWTNASKESKA